MKLTTPVAALLGTAAGGAFIAAALYLALRHPAPPPAPPPAPIAFVPVPQANPPPPATIAAPSSSSPAPPPPPDAILARAIADAARALDRQHDALTEKCWTPNARAPVQLTSTSYEYRIAVDARGHQPATGASLEARGPTTPAMDDCLAKSLAPITIPPPGTPLALDLRISFP